MTSLLPRAPWPALLVVLLGVAACEAGPDTFERPSEPSRVAAADAEPDTAAGVVLPPDSVALDSAGTAAAAAPRALGDGPATNGDASSAAAAAEAVATGSAPTPDVPSWGPGASKQVEEWGTERFPYPGAVRALYLNAWAAGSRTRIEQLIDLARRTEINSFVIDIKDASGYVSHRTQVPLAHEIGATGEVRIPDLAGLLARLEEEGIYPIARIVIVKDPLLLAARPDVAVQDTAGGVWVDGAGISWLNPYDTTVWRYHLDLAKEVAALGFPEIQWDYVRFPDAPRADLERAVFPGANGRSKARAIRDFLRQSREELAEIGVLSTADVFGVTTSSTRDVGIGQVWEAFIDVVDAALPMVYPSHYWQGSFGIRTPNAYPYEIVHRALLDATRRSDRVEGAGRTRPYLQDFTLGKPAYDAPEVRAQIQATYDAGIEEWVLWNPGSRYTPAALEPVGGWEEEPLMRVAGGIHPVSRRHAVMDSVRVAARLAEERARELRDSLSADSARVDSAAGGGVAPADSARAADTSAADTATVEARRLPPLQPVAPLRIRPDSAGAAADTLDGP